MWFWRYKVKVAQSCLTLRPHGLYTVHGILQVRILERVAIPFSRGSSQPRDQTHWRSHQCGSNPHWRRILYQLRWILYQLSHHGSPRILEWVPYPFSRASFQPRNQTGVSCIAGGFFTSWATREEIKCQVKMLWLQKISLLQADKILLTKCYLIWAPKSLMRLLQEQVFDLQIFSGEIPYTVIFTRADEGLLSLHFYFLLQLSQWKISIVPSSSLWNRAKLPNHIIKSGC